MEELIINGRKIEPINEDDAEFIYLKGNFECVELSFNKEVFEIYIRSEDLERLKNILKGKKNANI